MADTNANPAAGAAAGASAAAGTPAAGTTSTDPGYDELLRRGGDFALAEAKKHASRADSAEAQLRELKKRTDGLSRYFEAGLDGAKIAGHLGTMERMLADPKMGAVVKSFVQTGKLSPSNGGASGMQDDDEDEYLSEEQRELRAVKAELAAMRAEQHGTTSAFAQQAAERHLEQTFKALEIPEAEIPGVRSKVLEVVRGLAAQGDAGRSVMRSLMDVEKGGTTARTLVMEALGPDGLEKVYRAKFQREQQTRRGLATDVPSRGLAEAEAVPEFNSLHEALQWADAHPGVLDRMGY